MDPESSFELLLRARAGDRVALDDLCARYLPRLTRWAHGRLPEWARGTLETQDLVQETFAQVVRKVESFDPRHEGAFHAYLRQALLNRIRDEIRRSRRKGSFEPLDSARPTPDPSPLDQAIGAETMDRYESALQRLQTSDREAIIARVEMRLSWAEMAEALGKNSAASAQMTVRRALVRLAQEMSHGHRD